MKKAGIAIRRIFAYIAAVLALLLIVFPGWFAGEMPLAYKDTDGRLAFNLLKVNSISYNRALSNVHPYISPMIPFHPTDANLEEGKFISPGKVGNSGKTHWLGTDHLGRDVLSGIIWGARSSILVAFVAVFLAFLISFLLGGLTGYYGDNSYLIDRNKGILLIIFLTTLFIFFQWHLSQVGGAWKWLILIIGIVAGSLFIILKTAGRNVSLKIDSYISTFVNVVDSMPAIMVAIVFFLTYPQVNILSIAVLIGILKIPTFYRIIRSEIRRIKEKPYIQSAYISGDSFFVILSREMLPNIMTVVIVYALYTMASVIIIESTISFLNLGGVNPEYISWGKQLSLSRNYIQEWWLAIFPGMCIFLVIIFFRKMAERISDKSSYEF